ncbi:MAG: nucleotide exchange factor GrpE [Candidatus Sumerlaeaceae bacterium]
MRTLLRHLLADEFVIDEQPLPVFLSPDEDSSDLVQLTTKILMENEQLQNLNRELQQRSASPADLEKLIRGLLPTLDSFDRVLHLARSYPQSEAIDNWLKSVESIYFRLLSLLETYGLYQLKSVGSKVDLNLHEVVEYRPSDDHENETVISERQKGYVFRGKLLRDAKVVVAYNERR